LVVSRSSLLNTVVGSVNVVTEGDFEVRR
jgi:hypothetical protein